MERKADTTLRTDVFVSIGSNIDPERNIPAALERLAGQVRIVKVSTFYRNSPLDRPNQPAYLNGVCQLETRLPPRALKFDCLRTIEAALGRVRSDDKFAARTIDLDITLYGDLVVQGDDLSVPDPDVYERSFLAWPLYELAPAVVLPDTGRVLAEVAQRIDRDDLIPEERFTADLRARLQL